jgi:DNA-binding NarL/FixJ family response regulator
MSRHSGCRIADNDLSPALRVVFDHVLSGRDAREIAATLRLSRSTIRNQIIAIMRTFGVSSRLELLAIFVVRP